MGHGHAKRDVIEWMIPPLWPWKVITLPARGPQPKLKTEQMVTLKVMQDVELPQLTAYVSPSPARYYPDTGRRTNVAPRAQSYAQPSSGPVAPQSSSGVYYLPPSTPAAARQAPQLNLAYRDLPWIRRSGR